MTDSVVDWRATGERLRRIRKESGLSQCEFGRRFGVSQNMISLYEKGRSRASVDFYVQVAKFGGKSIEWLLIGSTDRTSETLREMRDLHDRMSSQLAVVRHLLDRESELALDTKLISIDESSLLRELLLEETDLPRTLRQAMERPEIWQNLSMNGREVWVFRMLVRLFGDMDFEKLKRFLTLVRSPGRVDRRRPGDALPGESHGLSEPGLLSGSDEGIGSGSAG